jgi:hypothetical protein
MKIEKIPLFLHIPRSAGSYCLYAMQSFFQRMHMGLNNVWLANVRILHPHAVFFATVRFNSNYWLKDPFMMPSQLRGPLQKTGKENKRVRDCEYETFRGYLKNGEASILSIKTLTDRKNKVDLRNTLYVAHELVREFGKDVLNVAVMRDPIERAISVYNYTSCSKSMHEPSHDSSIVSFEQACLENKIENNWVTRNLNHHHGALSLSWAKNACCFLSGNSFKIFDSSEAAKCLTQVVQECFNERLKSSEKNFFRNSSDKKFNLSQIKELSKEAKIRLLEATRWDTAVYQHFFDPNKKRKSTV